MVAHRTLTPTIPVRLRSLLSDIKSKIIGKEGITWKVVIKELKTRDDLSLY